MLRRLGKVGLGTVVTVSTGAIVFSDDVRKVLHINLSNNERFNGNSGILNDLERFSVTVFNVAITSLDYKWSLHGTDKALRPQEYKEALKNANNRAARRLFNVCYRHGGLYTKFGQAVANLDYALPPEFSKNLAPLQDRAKEMPLKLALQVVCEELGENAIENIFESFEEKPIAAASLAQVHRAVLRKNGETVAVKLQYPYLKRQMEGDIGTLRWVTKFVGYCFPDFEYSWLTPEFANNAILELDFVQESRNAKRMARLFAHRGDVRVPFVYDELTTKRLLTMEYVPSTKISDVDTLEEYNIIPSEVAKTVSSVFGDMIHVHGFVHCDPHPGNLGVVPIPSSFLEKTLKTVSAIGYASIIPLVLLVGLAEPGSAPALIGGVGTVVVTACSGLSTFLLGENQAYRHSFAGSSNGQPYQLVVYDHGMYRRLEPEFRSSYCKLWKALLLRDSSLGQAALMQLGVQGKYYDILSMVFTFRPIKNAGKTGEKLTQSERADVFKLYKDVNAGDINEFLELLPRDLLFVMRSTNIVRSINLSLGGTSRSRIYIMGNSAVRGLEVQNPSADAIEARSEPLCPITGAYRINLRVTSELVNTESISYRQAFEMWRLRMFLELYDSSWGLLAKLFSIL